MKKLVFYFLLPLSLMASNGFCQTKFDPKTLIKAYDFLEALPTSEHQRAFFDAFPNNYSDFDRMYGFADGANPCYRIATKHIINGFALLTVIPDSSIFDKLISISQGKPHWEADAQSYLRRVIYDMMSNKTDAFIRRIDTHTPQEQYEWWWFYWNHLLKHEAGRLEMERLRLALNKISPAQAVLFQRAFKDAFGNARMD